MRTPTQAMALVMTLGLGACSLPQAPNPKATYDLGPLPAALPTASATAQPNPFAALTTPATPLPQVAPNPFLTSANRAAAQPFGQANLSNSPTPSPAALPPQLRLADISAPPALGSTALTYRLQYAQALEPRAYTLARWSMPPAQLVQQRVRASLAANGWWLSTDHGPHTPTLHIELDAFEQVFDSAELSHGRVQWRASLRQGPTTLAQRSLQATAPAPTADAAGAAQALAAATTDATAQLVAWLATTQATLKARPQPTGAPSAFSPAR